MVARNRLPRVRPTIPEAEWRALAGPTGLLDERTGGLGFGSEWTHHGGPVLWGRGRDAP